LKISLQDNILTISGEKKSENKSEDKEKNYFRTERSYGSFTRSFTLPSEINPDSVDARFEDGVLKIKVDRENPKPVNERLIDIK
jgi:HSP20 family protein